MIEGKNATTTTWVITGNIKSSGACFNIIRIWKGQILLSKLIYQTFTNQCSNKPLGLYIGSSSQAIDTKRWACTRVYRKSRIQQEQQHLTSLLGSDKEALTVTYKFIGMPLAVTIMQIPPRDIRDLHSKCREDISPTWVHQHRRLQSRTEHSTHNRGQDTYLVQCRQIHLTRCSPCLTH